jgi:anti-sigma factor RsiW
MSERDCGYSEEELFLWLDGDLSPERRKGFETHLASCASCVRERDAYLDLFSRLEALAVPVPSPAFERSILDAARPAIEPWFTTVVAWAAVVAVLLSGLYFMNGRELLNRAMTPVAHLSARAVAEGAVGVIGAVNASASMFDLASVLAPLGRVVVVVGRAFQEEFVLFSLLLSLLAFAGAVRLADRSAAVERGVRRVCLALSL